MEFWGAENLDEAQGSVYGKLYKNWSKEDVDFYSTHLSVNLVRGLSVKEVSLEDFKTKLKSGQTLPKI